MKPIGLGGWGLQEITFPAPARMGTPILVGAGAEGTTELSDRAGFAFDFGFESCFTGLIVSASQAVTDAWQESISLAAGSQFELIQSGFLPDW